ncbi:MAG: MlaD family protein, partial [bacterium]|nr:MlaD family protein [bacterium]
MTEPGAKPKHPDQAEPIPTAVIKRRRVSSVWIVPVLALAVVGYLVWSQTMRDRGPMVTIVFGDAGGLEPGSEIIHRGVTVGVVREMALTDDLQSVSVTAELRPDAAGLAVDGTSFWVVRPEVSLQRIAGLETLVGPQYIALQPGDPDGNRVGSFVALDAPPRIARADERALRLTLRSDRLGNLSAGSPVLYREIKVGEVRHAVLSDDATG